jgi:hypothetical protein
VPTYTLNPSLRAKIRAFLIHQNPFYLLSALSMLAGCYALNSALSLRTGEIWKLLGLIAALNVYEGILIALGLYLIQRRRIIRDGRTLLLLESVFLADLTFLNAQAGSVSFTTGLLVSICLILLTGVKVTIILRVLWSGLPLRLLGTILLTLATLQIMPSLFAWYDHHGGVAWHQLYAGWWIAGAILALLGVTRVPFDSDSTPVQRVMRAIYIFLPLASLIVHLSMLHWVYRVPFAAADISPVPLGLVVLLSRSPIAREVRSLGIVVTAIAVLLAVREPATITIHNVPITTNEFTLAAAYTTLAYCFFRKWFAPLMAGGAGLAILILLGPTLEQTYLFLAASCRRVLAAVQMLIPQTAMEWGFVAVASSFAFLAMGAAVSLRKGGLPDAPASADSP